MLLTVCLCVCVCVPLWAFIAVWQQINYVRINRFGARADRQRGDGGVVEPCRYYVDVQYAAVMLQVANMIFPLVHKHTHTAHSRTSQHNRDWEARC